MATDLHGWLGLTAASSRLSELLQAITGHADPEVKAYSDAVYYNLYASGLSLVFKPDKSQKVKTGASRADLNEKLLTLTSIDIYNHEASLEPPPSKLRASESSSRTVKPKYDRFPRYPIRAACPSENDLDAHIDIQPASVGKDFVSALGEPDRKGGGEGSLGIWTEWTQHGLMVEFASAGLQAWDKGGEATWRTLTLFERGEVS